MNEKEKNTIIKNVKALMNLTGTTQEELANIVYEETEDRVPDAHYIANWFIEGRGIPDKYLEKVASYFGVSVNGLKKEGAAEELEKFMDNLSNIDLKDMVDVLENEFPYSRPFVNDEKSLKNDNFSKANRIHETVRLAYGLIKPEKLKKYVNECYKLYNYAYNDGIVEGLVNMIVISSFYKEVSRRDLNELRNLTVQQNKISNEELADFDRFVEDIILEKEKIDDFAIDYSDDDSLKEFSENYKTDKSFRKKLSFADAETIENNRSFISDTTNEIFDLLSKLNNYSEYKELVNYFIAKLTGMNLIKISDYNEAEHTHFSEMYMSVLEKLGNKYVINDNERFEKFTKCE